MKLTALPQLNPAGSPVGELATIKADKVKCANSARTTDIRIESDESEWGYGGKVLPALGSCYAGSPSRLLLSGPQRRCRPKPERAVRIFVGTAGKVPAPEASLDGCAQIILSIKKDPSFRCTTDVQDLLRWLTVRVLRQDDLSQIFKFPAHLSLPLAQVARSRVAMWAYIFRVLEHQMQ
ncbi:hypothetical protein ABH926_009223 [Catenulispora sp. GP43]|uniref:hypothetical protein n=1 Tax=Catenulispora sp. GP43 TaxID=3156263 RepID=UPI00351425AE